jgi:hypothetical protein
MAASDWKRPSSFRGGLAGSDPLETVGFPHSGHGRFYSIAFSARSTVLHGAGSPLLWFALRSHSGRNARTIGPQHRDPVLDSGRKSKSTAGMERTLKIRHLLSYGTSLDEAFRRAATYVETTDRYGSKCRINRQRIPEQDPASRDRRTAGSYHRLALTVEVGAAWTAGQTGQS